MSSLQLYVFEEENQNIFVHHDILLAGTPLCLEWLSHDVQKTGFSGSFPGGSGNVECRFGSTIL